LLIENNFCSYFIKIKSTHKWSNKI
jgi:hypothetical protein